MGYLTWLLIIPLLALAIWQIFRVGNPMCLCGHRYADHNGGPDTYCREIADPDGLQFCKCMTFRRFPRNWE